MTHTSTQSTSATINKWLGTLVLLFLGLFVQELSAQKLDHVQGEVLVQLKAETNPRSWQQKYRYFNGSASKLKVRKRVSAPMHIWSFTFDFAHTNELHLLDAIRRDTEVQLAQFNHLINLRSTIPNDPLFNQQWQYVNTGQDGGTIGMDLDIDLAWDISTGGVTATGDTIVICIIDDGIELNHNDLGTNLWVNKFEIPDNGIDDDNNNFVDDFQGWNTGTGTDNIGIDGSHGTPVTGIIGALGNNELGVSGVNWQIQLMIVHGGTGNEAEVLEAYSYPLAHRIRYNETDGAEGAFVVATNASWGVDNLFPEDAPLWCAYYDTLGLHGILNVGATTNEETDVDLDGDLPTSCPSDFLISVTNIDRNGQKVEAGFGATTIDLGAFGEETFTLALGNNYEEFGGTSGATPHVTGAIGLLYSIPCPALMSLVEENPAEAALLIRNVIMDGTVPTTSLDGITVTGGRLNINNSVQLLYQICGDCPEPLNINVSDLTDLSATINWTLNDSINQVDLRWRAVGGLEWIEATDVSSPFPLDNLVPCTGYEFQLQTYCNLDTIEYEETISFKTDGCCVPPTELSFTALTNSSATASWPAILAAESYNIRIREGELAEWMTFSSTTPNFDFSNLVDCTNYQVQVQTVCENMMTAFGPTQFFLTLGCGACTEAEYCLPSGNDSSQEWIDRVVLETLDNASGSDDGYGNYTSLPAPILTAGNTYEILLEPGFDGQSFNEYFLVWIDYDQDGNFEEEEIAFDAGFADNDAVSGMITIPITAAAGNTRMRVVMQFSNPSEACSLSGLAFGEMEDYCVEISPGDVGECTVPTSLDTANVASNMATLQWDAVDAALTYLVRYKTTATDIWTVVTANNNNFMLQGLQVCEEYEVQVRSSCADEGSDYSESFVFTTDCSTSTTSELAMVSTFEVFPNPFFSTIWLEVELTDVTDQLLLKLYSAQGQQLYESRLETLFPGEHRFAIETENLAAGLYFLRLEQADGSGLSRRLVKQN